MTTLKSLVARSCKIALHYLESIKGISRATMLGPQPIRVHHGGSKTAAGGPNVKISRMEMYFPDYPFHYNLIYSVSARIPAETCRKARRRSVKVICHTNSVYHPAYRKNYVELNSPIAEVHALADYVVYGSQHAKRGANRYLGPTPGPHSIIYNAVDTSHFRPIEGAYSSHRFSVLAVGLHYIRHRLEPLIRAMPYVLKKYPGARLVIAGPLRSGEGVFDCGPETIRSIISDVRLGAVDFIPAFTQQEAPEIYAQGDVLVHLKHMDWTPNTVIEAMACGLPVVHAGNGGISELVGKAGISLDLPFDWDRIHTPEPAVLAERIIEAYELHDQLGEAARQLAVERYDIRAWAAAHRCIFEELLGL
jgi:glycosyltransferase involved in cell wall biosynthesis